MSEFSSELVARRGDQMFPRLSDPELVRVSRFGERRSYRAGETVAHLGDKGVGLKLVLSGKVEITQHDGGERSHIVTHERGNFMGELAQLSGRPYLVDATALTDVESSRSRPIGCAPCWSPRPTLASGSCAR